MKIFLEKKDSQRSIYCREAQWQSVMWIDYENPLEIIC